MPWQRSVREDFISQLVDDQLAIRQKMEELQLVDGSSLRVLDVGCGEPLILLPMISELNFLYAPQIEEFNIDHRVVLYEPRTSRHSRFHIIDRAREVVLLINSLGLKSAHIVAWSDAGAAAYCLAKFWPELCRSIVFIGLPDCYKLPQPIGFLMKLLWRTPVERFVPSLLLAHILALFMKGPQVKHSWIVNYAATIPQLSRLFKYSCLPNMIEHKPIIDEVINPSLVICGERDPVVSAGQAHRMASLLPGAREPIIIPSGEHCSVYVNAVEVNRALRAFYLSLPRTV